MNRENDSNDPDESSMNKQERTYKCQRCLNHNRVVCRKGHRCPYKECVCPGCDLNNLRSKLMTVLREKGLSHSEVFMTKKAGRKQHCMLCSFHGERVELRGHKKKCSWANCHCALCVIGRHYRDTMAKQTKHRRSQRKPGVLEQSPVKTDRTKVQVTGASKRVVMKKDWRQLIRTTRIQNNRASISVDQINNEIDIEIESDNERAIRTEPQITELPRSDATNDHHSPNPDLSNAQFQMDQNVLQQVGLINSVRATSTDNICANSLGPFTSLLNPDPISINPLGSHTSLPPSHAVGMAAALAFHQQRAADIAAALLASRYSSLPPSSIFPMAALCMSCQQPSPSTSGHSVWHTENYVNVLRDCIQFPPVLSRPEAIATNSFPDPNIWSPADTTLLIK